MLSVQFDWNWSSESRGDFWFFLYLVFIFPSKRAWPFTWTNLSPIYPRILRAKFGWNWHSGDGDDFKFCLSCIFTIPFISPLERGCDPSFEQKWVPFTQECFVPSLVEISSVVLEKKIFLISLMYFHYFVIISPRKRAGTFIWTNLNSLHPRMLCAKNK